MKQTGLVRKSIILFLFMYPTSVARPRIVLRYFVDVATCSMVVDLTRFAIFLKAILILTETNKNITLDWK